MPKYQRVIFSWKSCNKVSYYIYIYLNIVNKIIRWDRHREYLIAKVPTLVMIEGKEVVKSERIKAKQILEELEVELQKLSESNIIKKQIEIPDENAYTVEYRKRLYRELEEERLKKEEDKSKSKNSNPYFTNDYDNKPLSVYKEDGEIRVCNQGRYKFFIDENKKTGIVTFELALPKHLDTTQIKVDLNPKYIRVEVKDKITQWRFENEVFVENSIIQRSQTTGFLLIKAYMVNFEDKELKLDNDKKLLKLEESLKDGSRLIKQIEEQENERKKATQQKNKTKYYDNKDNKNSYSDSNIESCGIGNNVSEKGLKQISNDVFTSSGNGLKPINSLDIIHDVSLSNNQKLNNNRTKLINYSDVNSNRLNESQKGNNTIKEVKNQDSMINPEETINKKRKFEEIIKDVDLDEIPELD